MPIPYEVITCPDAPGTFGKNTRVVIVIEEGRPRIFISDPSKNKIYTSDVCLLTDITANT